MKRDVARRRTQLRQTRARFLNRIDLNYRTASIIESTFCVKLEFLNYSGVRCFFSNNKRLRVNKKYILNLKLI